MANNLILNRFHRLPGIVDIEVASVQRLDEGFRA